MIRNCCRAFFLPDFAIGMLFAAFAIDPLTNLVWIPQVSALLILITA